MPSSILTRRTRILATIGPASESPEVLEKLINAGLNGCRLNFSHGSREEHKKRIETIRSLEKKLGKTIAIVQDLSGPKVRTDNKTYNIKKGEKWLLVPSMPNNGDIASAQAGNQEEHKIGIQHPNLHSRLKAGDKILLDDGNFEMKVLDVTNGVLCEIVIGGELKPRKSVNTPGVDNGLDVLSEKDREDLAFGKENGINWVAVSFVRSAEDMRRVREYAKKELNWDVPLISKIETPLAIQNLEAIVQESDGVMVARGDLGIECPIEEVPVLQKRCLELAKNYNKLSIVATQMLESMTLNPRPTRAEASDVSNAVFESTQVVMLSGETASGYYPLQAVETMHKICSISENTPEIINQKQQMFDVNQKLLGGALRISEISESSCIVVACKEFQIAKFAASFHGNKPIVAIFDNESNAQTAALFYGVVPLLVEKKVSLYDLERLVRDTILKWGFAQKSDLIPLVFAQPRIAEHLNTIRIVRI